MNDGDNVVRNVNLDNAAAAAEVLLIPELKWKLKIPHHKKCMEKASFLCPDWQEKDVFFSTLAKQQLVSSTFYDFKLHQKIMSFSIHVWVAFSPQFFN